MGGTVPVELLYTALGLCSSLVGLLFILLRRERLKNGSDLPANPSSIHELSVSCRGRLSGIAEALGRIETAQIESTKVLVEIRTILGERQ